MKHRIFVGGVFAGVMARAVRAAKVKAGHIPMRTFGKTGARLTIVGQAGGRFPLLTG